MIQERDNVKISKFISLILRHKPETYDVILDKNGWADTKDLIEKINVQGFELTFDILNHIVSTNKKQRFSFNENKSKIRASQGHSFDVELDLKETEPPQYLYHGSAEKSISSILATGLERRNRQYVHLSNDIETAIAVGQRYGKAVVFIVDATRMRNEGYSFYLSDNNVWLIEHVPAKYLTLLEK